MKKYKVVMTHKYMTACGWDSEEIDLTDEIETDDLYDVWEEVNDFMIKFSGSSPKVEYFKQTIENLPTIVNTPVDEYGEKL